MANYQEPLDLKELEKLAQEAADREERELLACNGKGNVAWQSIVFYKIGYKDGYRVGYAKATGNKISI